MSPGGRAAAGACLPLRSLRPTVPRAELGTFDMVFLSAGAGVRTTCRDAVCG
ncbi:hypothetical protein ACWCQW_27460 [Streptomyces mirabilis]